MKRLLLSLASLLMATMPLMVSAQKLTVEYESKINANSPDAMKDAGLPDEMRHNGQRKGRLYHLCRWTTG